MRRRRCAFISLFCLTCLTERYILKSGKGGARKAQAAKESQKGPVAASVKAEAAKAAVTTTIAEKVKEISENFFCQKHSRCCYVKFNGEHGLYSNVHLTMHAKLLVRFTHFALRKYVTLRL